MTFLLCLSYEHDGGNLTKNLYTYLIDVKILMKYNLFMNFAIILDYAIFVFIMSCATVQCRLQFTSGCIFIVFTKFSRDFARW